MSNDLKNADIRKVKVLPKGGLEIRYMAVAEEDGIPSNKEYTFKNDRVPHKTFFNTLRLLMAHAGLIAELPTNKPIDAKYMKGREVIDDPNFIKFEVTGFTIKGDGDGESVTLEIEKKLTEGDKIKMVLPSVKLYSGSDYAFSGNLSEDIGLCIGEVEEYMAGKYQESNQLVIDYDSNDENQF